MNDVIRTADEIVEPRCPRSKNHEGRQPHVCPFRWEINDDSETLCTCCDDCTTECADDI